MARDLGRSGQKKSWGTERQHVISFLNFWTVCRTLEKSIKNIWQKMKKSFVWLAFNPFFGQFWGTQKLDFRYPHSTNVNEYRNILYFEEHGRSIHKLMFIYTLQKKFHILPRVLGGAIQLFPRHFAPTLFSIGPKYCSTFSRLINSDTHS